MKKLTPANCLTGFRIAGAIALIFIRTLSVPFYIVYSLCGLSDALDGLVARMTKTAGDFGARLDSAADIVFYAVMIWKLIPILWWEDILPLWCWYWVVGIMLFRVGIYIFAFLKFHRFPSLHTMLNKCTSLMVFLAAFLVRTPVFVVYFAIACTVGTLAGVEELFIHLYNRRYGGEVISIRRLMKDTYQSVRDKVQEDKES